MFTNPDMSTWAFSRPHAPWARFMRGPEVTSWWTNATTTEGVFGSHTALVLRRLLRVAARYGSTPVVIWRQATTADPRRRIGRMIGADCVAVTEDGSPHGAAHRRTVGAAIRPRDHRRARRPVRRPAGAEAARILAELVRRRRADPRASSESRRGAELTALSAARMLAEATPALRRSGGRLPRGLSRRGSPRARTRPAPTAKLLGVATTNALELGVDIAGLDAIVVAGFPGTVASFWQQAGRAGRRGEGSLVVLIARDDPLDTYLVNHPEALLDKPVEATVIDPTNPYVLGPQLLCAAAELPLKDAEVRRLRCAGTAGRLARQGLHPPPQGGLVRRGRAWTRTAQWTFAAASAGR